MGMNKKLRRTLAKAAKAAPTAPTAADTTAPPAPPAPTAPDDVVVPVPDASLPARKIRNSVAGTGASSTFKGVGTMREHGIPAGLRRNEFQDRLLEWNESSEAHLSDDELAAIMDREHPLGGVRIADRPELVAVIRKFYNAGTHGKQQQAAPDVLSLQYEKPKPKAAADVDEAKAS